MYFSLKLHLKGDKIEHLRIWDTILDRSKDLWVQ